VSASHVNDGFALTLFILDWAASPESKRAARLHRKETAVPAFFSCSAAAFGRAHFLIREEISNCEQA
jgi:hypothetical protein